jgi:hypothetical protein
VKQKCSWRVVRRAEKRDLYKIVRPFDESRFCRLFPRQDRKCQNIAFGWVVVFHRSVKLLAVEN